MSACLDASVVVSLFLIDSFSPRARALLGAAAGPIVSDWCVVEVSGVIARQVRLGAITAQDSRALFSNFDSWRTGLASVTTSEADMQAAAQFVRRADLALRGPDALHIAICARIGAKLMTFDARLGAAANVLGVETGP